MKWTGLNELRESYLSYFESKEHLRLDSFSLVPNNDKSLLLINSGMAPMKKYFTGEITPPRKRVTTCQKCIRTPDIESVGITARHGTYFEMLGNFSFGDYFKHEATAWAWEFFTKVLEIPAELLYCSIYENDDEAGEIWTKEVGVDPSHIVKLGKADNFWEHGSGPCGPCSEIYFDRGEKYGCGSPTCGVGCDCDRYMEVWNLVFTQFDNDGNDNYTPLAKPNIDTGMGLERLACVLQGVDNLFLVDTVANIMKKVSEISGVAYGSGAKSDISLRVITDHIRSTTFMISDGVMPSNAGRGYVLRRLLRRAARHGRLLGVDRLFLSELCDTVIEENKSAYPALLEKKEFIKKVLLVEEENFAKTIDSGLALLNDMIENANSTVLCGDDAFKLNDTFGFPIDLTKEILAEKGMSVDEDRFKELLQIQKTTAKANRAKSDGESWASNELVLEGVNATEFVGYTNSTCESKIVAIVANGEKVDSASEDDEVIIILDKTSFYATSGGQVGDSGKLVCGTAVIKVLDTTKNPSGLFMHKCVVEDGEISTGATVNCEIDTARHSAIMKNHTAAHILQASLRKVLGTHVEQAGQLVNEKEVRFDFTHFSALTTEELQQVEDLVNAEIMNGSDVTMQEMSIDDAKKIGAMALFGEKYGDVVRVVTVGDCSIELCGGTHINNSAKLGLFKITAESSVAAGVRRITAVTGSATLELLNSTLAQINEVCATLKVNNKSELLHKTAQVVNDLKVKEKEVEALNSKLSEGKTTDMINNGVDVKGCLLVTGFVENIDGGNLRAMCDKIRDIKANAVALLVGANGDKVAIASAVGKEAQKLGANAGMLVKEIAKLAGGNGGGRPDSAMAGAKDANLAKDALNNAQEILSNLIK